MEIQIRGSHLYLHLHLVPSTPRLIYISILILSLTLNSKPLAHPKSETLLDIMVGIVIGIEV